MKDCSLYFSPVPAGSDSFEYDIFLPLSSTVSGPFSDCRANDGAFRSNGAMLEREATRGTAATAAAYGGCATAGAALPPAVRLLRFCEHTCIAADGALCDAEQGTPPRRLTQPAQS